MNNRAMSLPENWQFRPFGDIVISSQYGLSDKTSSHGIPILGMSSITAKGTLVAHAESFVEIDKEVELRYKLRALDLLFNRTNSLALVGKTAIVSTDLPHVFASYLVRFKLSSEVDAAFVHAFFNLGRSVQCLKSLATPGVSQFNINPTQLMRYFHVAIPPLPEQKKIARTLSTWDRAIEIVERLIEAKERQKKGLMQLLLTGKKRLGGFREPWKMVRLGDVFSERVETGQIDLPLLSITRTDGIVDRSAVDRKDSSNGDKSLYRRIAPGDIGYNTMRMWQGVSGLSKLEGIVSPAYTIVIPGKEIFGEFIKHLFKFPPMINLFRRYSQGLVSDTLNLKYHHFSQIRVRLPMRREQENIAAILDRSDRETELLRSIVSTFDRQKRGLTQQLLTGQVRVKIDNWEAENGK